MKKVTAINLNGRAYQVEEAGFAALQTYLKSAEEKLASNPDKSEILADIEQAIADKCDGVLQLGKNVVSAEAIREILDKIGPIEETSDTKKSENASDTEPKVKKLYLLPKEGKLSGVCAGVAAYFGMDVTVVRLFFVLLLFLTQGFMLIVYIVMAIAMTEAKTPEEIAAAHGRPMTAQDIMSRVNVRAPSTESLNQVGSTINQIGRVIAQVIAISALIVWSIGTAVLVWLLWAMALGYIKLYDNLDFLNGWHQGVFILCVYLLFALPLHWIYRSFMVIGKGRGSEELSKSTRVAAGTSIALWAFSLVTIVAFVSFYATDVASYVRAHQGYIDIGKSNVCLDPSRCHPAETIEQPIQPIEVQYNTDTTSPVEVH